MKDIEVVFDDLRQWEAEGGVGRYIVMRRPDGTYTCAVEQVIKMRELPMAITETINQIMGFEQAMKMNVVTGKNGLADRIEVFRLR